jgi:CubicO group peptidase (beta-lactamase class C family)
MALEDVYNFMKSRKIILLIILLLQVATTHGQTTNFISKWDSLISWHKKELKKVNIIGNGILFLKNGKIIAESMNGFQDKETLEPININSIYNWASCTKMFTAIAIMQLRDQGKLDLSSPVSKYLPEIKDIPNEFNKEFTIKNILTHSSGLPRFSKTTKLIDGNFYETKSIEEYFQGFKEVKLQFEADKEYRYSNFGYDLLGLIVERVSQQSYKDYITKSILKSLGMNKSYFGQLPTELKEYRSNNYRGHKGKLYSRADDFDNVNNTVIDFPSGGLNAPFTDMILFINFLCGSDSLTNNTLKYSSLEEMFSVQKLIHGIEKDGEGHEHFVGLGFNIVNPGTYRLIGHEGESSGFMTSLWVNPVAKTGYLFGWNTTYRLPNKKDDDLFVDFNHVVYEKLFPLLK